MEEAQPWGKTIYSINTGSHVHFQTPKQKVDLITNPHFGRMLFLDGALQSATADEEIYHKTLVQEAMGLRSQERILIAGGAEGATLREVQNYDAENNLGVKEIVMVDWDEELVKHMDKEEPWSQGSFDDPRLQLLFQDIDVYLDSKPNTFHTILLDLLDINTDEEADWTRWIIEKSLPLLESKGCLVLNIGRSSKRAKEICFTFQDQCTSKVIEIVVPSFQEPWYLVRLMKD